jgi:hypothetical protein
VDNDSYHRLSAIGSSGLKALAKSPAHFWAEYEDPDREPKEATEAMEFGTLIHAIVLEPETVRDVSRKLSAKVVRNINVAQKVASSILGLPDAQAIVNHRGMAERTLLWKEPVRDLAGRIHWVECKIRPDYLIPPDQGGIILDVKSSKDASPGEFPRQAYNLGYHIQAAWYCRGYMVCYGAKERPSFRFLAGEKTAPFLAASYEASQAFLDAGARKIQGLLQTLVQCRSTGIWPGYSSETQSLDLPRWAKENYDE